MGDDPIIRLQRFHSNGQLYSVTISIAAVAGHIGQYHSPHLIVIIIIIIIIFNVA